MALHQVAHPAGHDEAKVGHVLPGRSEPFISYRKQENCINYFKQIENTAVDCMDYILRNLDQANSEYPGDMMDVLNKYAFEAICKIALDTR